MKKYGLLFLLFALATGSGHAQNGDPDGITVKPYKNWYQDGTTVEADGITFEVEVSKYNFFLSNATNTKKGGTLYYRDGTEVEEWGIYESALATFSKNDLLGAIKESFTEEELAPLRNFKRSPMTIGFVVGPYGETLEVDFAMNAVMLSIPPAKFALLERKLKQNVQWTVNVFGQQLQYFYMMMFINFSKMNLDDIPPFNDAKQPSEWDKTPTDDKPTGPTPVL